MADESGTTVRLQRCLDRLHAGDEAARDELLNVACDRLARLTRQMFKADGRLRRWEEPGDVFQDAMLRLCRALRAITPRSLCEFYRLAALQVRRALIDLARRHYGPGGSATHHQTPQPDEDEQNRLPPEAHLADVSHEPSLLAAWGEFHHCVGDLPEEEREVFDLVWYQGLTQADAAKLLGVSTKTVQRRWQAACLRLDEAMAGELPGL
jgi:RNA polymerase sigma-70 factor (ECF subfamily)